MIIFAIDPGTEKSGYCLYSTEGGVIESSVVDNKRILDIIKEGNGYSPIVIEMVASYGCAVGKEVFETCVWIGRFMQWAVINKRDVYRVYRKDIKMHLCHTMKAKDANIRQALIDRFGSIGTKKNPGKLYGVKSHAWAALALAVYYADTHKEGNVC